MKPFSSTPSVNTALASPAAWLAFFDEHRQALTAYALSLTPCPADAEDLVQDVLVAMVARDVSARHPRAYVFTAMRHRAADTARSARTHANAVDALAPFIPSLCNTLAAYSGEDLAELRSAVRELPGSVQEVLVLRLRSGLTIEEVAAVLEKPVGTIAAQYARAVQTLKLALQPLALGGPHD